MKTYIYGKHPVHDALEHRSDVVEKVFLEPAQYPDIDTLAKKCGVFRMPFEEKALEKKLGEHAVHQNIAAIVDTDRLMHDFHSLLKSFDISNDSRAMSDTKHSSAIGLVILGEIQDPQNVGSIIRSAAAFGLSGVLIPKDRQAQLTGSVIKASVGTAFKIPLVAIGNVNQTVRELKEKRFWVYGLSGDGKKSIRDEDFSENSVFIVGNEAKGLREKTSEHCDVVLRIPITDTAESLNAGTSAAIAFYEWKSKQP